jgi:hypothetical protein
MKQHDNHDSHRAQAVDITPVLTCPHRLSRTPTSYGTNPTKLPESGKYPIPHFLAIHSATASCRAER